jgi:uncharacterized membrane protein
MIIDIALGIVLAVVILRYWPVIVGLGIAATIGVVLLAIGGAVIYFVFTNEVVLQKVTTLAILLAVFLMGSWVSHLIAQRTVLKMEEIGVLLTITIFLIAMTIFFFPFIFKWATDAHEPQLFLFLIPLVGLWMWLWFKLSRLLRTRNAELVNANKEA